jgi:biotin carboxylase
MKRILLVATTTGYQIRSFGEAAEALGVRLRFASDRCDQLDDPWWDQAIPVRFHDEASAAAAVMAACADAPPDAVLAVGDRPTMLAARLNAAWGLPGHPPVAAAATRDKRRARAAFRAAGLLTPRFRDCSIADDPALLARALEYPSVIKPVALSGSRGVMRVDDAPQFVSAFARLRALLQSADVRLERDAAHGRVLVEDFIPGAEYAVEGVLTRGAFHPFAIFDKPDPLDGPFFEETLYVTPSRQPQPIQDRIIETVAAGAAALGLQHGPVHAECRVNGTGVYLLEIAARPIGGICSRALRFRSAAGDATASLEEVLMRHALGEDIAAWRRETRPSGVMMLPIPRRGVYRGVSGIDEARAVAGVDDVRITAKPDTVIVPLPEGRSYLGFIFAHASSAEDVEQSLRTAHQCLRWVIEKELTVVNEAPGLRA